MSAQGAESPPASVLWRRTTLTYHLRREGDEREEGREGGRENEKTKSAICGV